MIRVICAILAVAIENLKLRMNNPYLPMRKSAVCFDPSFQKESSGRSRIFTTTSCLWLFKSGRSLEDSSNQDNNNVRLPPVRAGKRLTTVTANRKLASSKLSSASTKLALGIEQDVRAEKGLTLKTS